MPIAAREYASEADLRRMQALVAAVWQARGPLAPTHIGDLAWWMYQHVDKLREVRVRLWLDGGEAVAYGILWRDRHDLDFAIHPDRPELIAEVVEWSKPSRAWTLDADAATVGDLRALGFRPTNDTGYEHHVRDLQDDIAAAALPRGYRVRTVRDESDLDARVAVHRAAFHPSRVVQASYGRLMEAWPYRPDLDHVVEAPDGSFAAFCLAWLDDENAAGLLEPVGTHPEHRRMGLAAAVCRAALAELRARGARHAVVLSNSGSAATGLYEKIGMHALARHVAFARGAGKGTDDASV